MSSLWDAFDDEGYFRPRRRTHAPSDMWVYKGKGLSLREILEDAERRIAQEQVRKTLADMDAWADRVLREIHDADKAENRTYSEDEVLASAGLRRE